MTSNSKRRQIVIACWLTSTAVLSGCATVSPAKQQVACPVLPPVPASVMQARSADFSKRMSDFLFDSPTKPTP